MLQHPLEELQPVAAHLGGGLPPGDWAPEAVLWTSIELLLAITVDQVGATADAPADLTGLQSACTDKGRMQCSLARISVQRLHEQASNTCTVWRLGGRSVASGHHDTVNVPAAPHTPATPPLPPLPPGSVPGSAARWVTCLSSILQTVVARTPPV